MLAIKNINTRLNVANWLAPRQWRQKKGLLTDKTRIHLQPASVGIYPFSPQRFPRFLSICGARGSLAFDLTLI
jgi:hypothetical protein